MKLIEKYSAFSKEDVYEKYQSIVYATKKYANITKNQMLKDIIKEFEQEDYLYYMCTKRELKVLDKIIKNKLDKSIISKYEWEISTLSKKLIIDESSLEIYEELKELVSNALDKFYKEGESNSEMVIITFIGLIRTYGAINQEDFIDIACGITHLEEDDILNLLGSPLFHFYCYPFAGKQENIEPIIIYRDYIELLDFFLAFDLDITFRILPSFNYKYFESMFYYGYPTSIKKVNKMYKEITKIDEDGSILSAVNLVRLFGHRDTLALQIQDDELLKLVYEALDKCPEPAQLKANNEKNTQDNKDDFLNDSVFADSRFPNELDKDAHLSQDDSALYDKIYLTLLEYTNKKYNLTNAKKVYKNKKIRVDQFYKIEHYFWNNLGIIDEFIEENAYNFNEFELELASSFKKSIRDEFLIIVGFTADYIELLSEDDKLYMVKSPKKDFSFIFYDQNLPIKTDAKLSEFKGNIVFNTFFKTSYYNKKEDNDEILERKKKAFKYYHL